MNDQKFRKSGGLNLSRSDLSGLRVFEAVARNRGFTTAQSELGLRQPSISNHIAALETRLGVRLCDRGATGFELTEKGRMVLTAAQRLFAAMDTFSDEVGDLRERIVGTLRLGVVDAIATDPALRLPQAIATFKSAAPDARIEISEDTPHLLQERVRQGELHFGVGSFTTRVKDLSYLRLHTEHHSLYCAIGHPLFDRPDTEIDEDAVRAMPVVGRGYWREEMTRAQGLSNVMALSYQIEPQLLLVMSGGYLGFLPDHFTSTWVARGQLRRVRPDTLSYTCTFHLIYRKYAQRTRLFEAFLNSVTAVHNGNEEHLNN